jgi:hypothetical protein
MLAPRPIRGRQALPAPRKNISGAKQCAAVFFTRFE